MQIVKLLYENRYSVYLAAGGFCVLSRKKKMPRGDFLEPGVCLIFYPEDFEPGEAFCRNAENFCLRTKAKLLWIENPGDSYPFWNCVAAAERKELSIEIGMYHICFGRLKEEREDALVFEGSFGVSERENFAVTEPGMVFDLSGKRGALSFSFCSSSDVLAALDAGMRFFLPLSEKTGQETGGMKEVVSEFSNQVLHYAGEGTYRAVITPCMLWEIDQTYITLPEGVYESEFLSGKDTVRLVSKDARLVLEKAASVITREEQTGRYVSGEISCYFGIAGTFTAVGNENMQIMPGMSGAEYIRIDQEITFVPHQSGLAVQDSKADSPVTTAWLQFQGTYFSSSESMPLYTTKQDGGSKGYLRAYTPAAAVFSQMSPAVPVMLWKNAFYQDDREAKQAEDILYQNRFGLLTGYRKQEESKDSRMDEGFTAVAPCGVCVSIIEEENRWEWMGIAQTSGNALPDVRLYSLSDETRAALQQKECILLILDAEKFAALGTVKNQIVLLAEGWEIVLSEEYWEQGQTLMLMKYSTLSTIRELLKDTPQLQYVLSQAYTEKEELKPEYGELFRVMDDPWFQGLFLLGAAALPVEVTPEVSVITSDIAQGAIRARYTIVERSRVDVAGAAVKVQKSDISSLFSYEGKSIVNDSCSSQTVDCRTVGLTVRVEHSKLKQFSSRMELMLAELMGAELSPVFPENGKCLVLKGTLLSVDEQQVYQFLLEGSMAFQMKDTPVEEICFESLGMVSGEKETGFVLAGTLSFAKVEGCDLFSYGKLPFSGLLIAKREGSYALDYSNILLRQEYEEPREKSFAEAFGAKLTEGLFCRSEESPDKLGFSSIMSPVKQGVMEKAWNGLVWKLPLGNSGELGGSDELAFEMITAWSHKKYYIGMRMPGIFQKSFSLQGIIGAGFSGLELLKGKGDRLYFKVHGLTLKILGFSFPKNGTELLLSGEHGKIAWYAGYEEKEEDRGQKDAELPGDYI